jgi:ribose/xylose/arabinose/galactoside ABC-type transport system permease subunit
VWRYILCTLLLIHAGLLVSFILAFNAVAGAGPKLKAFLADVVGDADIAGGSSESQFKGGAKAE